jgi:hypothetical protein
MNDETKSIWKRPWKGPAKVLGWFGLLAGTVFLTVCSLGFLSDQNSPVSELVLYALIVSVAIAAVGVAIVLFVRWLCCWRNFCRFLFGVACFVTLIALIFFEENVRGRSAWLKHKQACEAKGEKFLITELAPRAVPDEQNFALTPLLKPALDYSRVNGAVVWNDTNGLARLDKLRVDLSPDRKPNEHLVLGSLDKGTFADLTACREFYRSNTNYPQPAVSGTAAEDILFALGGFDAAFRELREATLTRPLVRFPIEYGSEPPWGILLPHLSRMKGLTTLTSVRATAELEAGRPADALADFKVGFRLSEVIHDEPFLIDHLVRISTLSINLQTVREGLARRAWTDAQLVELEKYLASVDVLAEYRFAMRGERALSTGGLDFLRRQGFRSDPMMYMDNEGGAATHYGLNPMPSGWFYQNMLTISQMHQDFTIAAADEKAHRVFPELGEQLNARLEKMSKRPYTIFAKMLMPAVGKAVGRSARTQVFVDAARVACALERHRLASGALPETLESLSPRYLEKIPTDVIDGKPLRYHRNLDGGYILYSVGWNQTDDGGEIAWSKGKDPRVDISQGDWVWQMPGK